MIEIFKYGIIGALTTFLNIFIYFILRSVLNLNYILSSIIAWILALIFSFFANRNFVFEKKEKLKNKVLKEQQSFKNVWEKVVYFTTEENFNKYTTIEEKKPETVITNDNNEQINVKDFSIWERWMYLLFKKQPEQ